MSSKTEHCKMLDGIVQQIADELNVILLDPDADFTMLDALLVAGSLHRNVIANMDMPSEQATAEGVMYWALSVIRECCPSLEAMGLNLIQGEEEAADFLQARILDAVVEAEGPGNGN